MPTNLRTTRKRKASAAEAPASSLIAPVELPTGMPSSEVAGLATTLPEIATIRKRKRPAKAPVVPSAPEQNSELLLNEASAHIATEPLLVELNVQSPTIRGVVHSQPSDPTNLVTPTLSKKLRAAIVSWTPLMTEVLIHEVLNQIRAGKRSDNGFKAETWSAISREIQTKAFGPVVLNGEKCQGKLDTVS
ncbi:hypothetical protein EDC01DRAFT_636017 [Geopyxis carbonaria]|nr:hypothetical protein EDC01DRAFT_636017 [Geopyxis carbonaria]